MRQETQGQKAGRIILEELERIGWKQKDLAIQPKGSKDKIAIAQRLRVETTVPLKTIAEQLEMGSWTYLSNLLSAERKKKGIGLCQ